MRSVLRASVVLMVVCGLALTAGVAAADVVGTTNLFSGQTVAGEQAFNSSYALNNAVDGTTAASGFADGAASRKMSISGFTSDIDRIRFFESGFTQRTSASVDIYYSSAVTSSLNGNDYTFLGNFEIPNEFIENIDGAGSWGHRYLTPTDPAETGPGTQLWPIKWSELTGLGIPSGTQSVLFNFLPDNWNNLGSFFSEIQAFAATPLIRVPGDANYNGVVDEYDASVLAANWLKSGKTWGQGDFNGDGIVNDADATLMATNWSGTSSSSSVPEPAALMYLAAMALAFAFAAYRRRAN